MAKPKTLDFNKLSDYLNQLAYTFYMANILAKAMMSKSAIIFYNQYIKKWQLLYSGMTKRKKKNFHFNTRSEAVKGCQKMYKSKEYNIYIFKKNVFKETDFSPDVKHYTIKHIKN